MSRWVKYPLILVGVAGLSAVAALWIASARWNRATAQAADSLLQAVPQQGIGAVNFTEFDELPPPVAKYFRWALTDGQPLVKSARIRTAGEFNSTESEEGWRPFEATQVFTAQPPGFVWDAAIHMAPMMDVRVRDRYEAGQGAMFGAALGAIPVVNQAGAPELNAGALIRYLGEVAWLPTALLPSMGVVWTPIDERSALATLDNAGSTVSLEFHFDDDGKLVRIFTPARPREVNGAYENAAWQVTFYGGFEQRDGMQIPVEATVEWQLPDRSIPYWKGRIVDAEYDFGP